MTETLPDPLLPLAETSRTEDVSQLLAPWFHTLAIIALLAGLALLSHFGHREITTSDHPVRYGSQMLMIWMLLFVDYIAAKQIIAPALNTFVGGPTKLYEASRAQIQGAIDALVRRAIKSGDIRKDLDPFDLLRALVGVSNVASSPDWQESARRLVEILITGSRPAK